MLQKLDDDTKAHIKRGEALNMFWASLHGLSGPLTILNSSVPSMALVISSSLQHYYHHYHPQCYHFYCCSCDNYLSVLARLRIHTHGCFQVISYLVHNNTFKHESTTENIRSSRPYYHLFHFGTDWKFLLVLGWRFGAIQSEMSNTYLRWCTRNSSLDGTRTSQWKQQSCL